MLWIIGKLDMAEHDLCVFCLFKLFTRYIFRGLIQHSEHTLCTGNRCLKLPINLSDFINRTAELLRINNERWNNTDGDQTFYWKISSEGGDNDKSNIADTVHNRAHDTTENIRFDTRLGKIIGSFAKLLCCDVLMVISDNGTVARYHFLHCSVELT